MVIISGPEMIISGELVDCKQNLKATSIRVKPTN